MAVLPAGRPFCPGTASVGSGPGKLALLSSRRASRRAEGRPSAGLGRGRGPGSGVESAGLPHFRGGAGTRILWIPPAGGSENYGIRLPSSDAGKSSVENGTGESYLFQLVQYLQQLEPSCTVATGQEGELFLTVEGERYQIWRTLSPFWLPLAVKEEDGDRILVFGPFAAQDWGRLYPYYDWEAFRDTIALYDPWRQEKMSLCRGRVPVYIDWFHRDQYQGRFSIPVKFCDVLHQLGLMRYNDER